MEKKSHRKTEKNERNGNQDQRLKRKSRPLEIESTISTATKRAVGTRIRKFEKKTEFDKLKKQNNHVTELRNQELEELRPKGHSYLVCVRETAIKEEVRSLQHEDVEVLSLEIMDKSPGTVILEKLKKLAECVGTPVQIISDWRSDIKKRINLYKEENPGVRKHLGEELCVAHEEIICQYSDLGRRSFYKKFGWLFNYEQDIDT